MFLVPRKGLIQSFKSGLDLAGASPLATNHRVAWINWNSPAYPMSTEKTRAAMTQFELALPTQGSQTAACYGLSPEARESLAIFLLFHISSNAWACRFS
jgi:hypothetical protein